MIGEGITIAKGLDMASRISHYYAHLAIVAAALTTSSVLADFTPECIPDRMPAAMHGPFQFGIEHSSKTGWMFDPKYVNDICAFDALALEFGFGSQIFRFSSTWGHALDYHLFTKLTVEYLAQDPTFYFTSGDIDRWYGQWDLGWDIQYKPLHIRGLHSVHFGLTSFNSQTENLWDQPNFAPPAGPGGTNIRRVCGTNALGADFGVTLQPWRSGYFDVDLYYDSLSYYRVNEAVNGSSGIGFGGAINQNLSDCILLTLSGTDRRPYYEYFARIKWIPLSTVGSLFEVAFQLTSDGGSGAFQGREERAALSISYSWGCDSYSTPRNYHDPLNRGVRQDLVDYTNIPAVRPPQVFEQIDQKTVYP